MSRRSPSIQRSHSINLAILDRLRKKYQRLQTFGSSDYPLLAYLQPSHSIDPSYFNELDESDTNLADWIASYDEGGRKARSLSYLDDDHLNESISNFGDVSSERENDWHKPPEFEFLSNSSLMPPCWDLRRMRVSRFLHEGASSSVLLAIVEENPDGSIPYQEEVVIKAYRHSEASVDFHNELALLQTCQDHSGIVSLRGWGSSNGRYALILDYLKGDKLSHALKYPKPVKPHLQLLEKLSWSFQIADIVCFLAQKGIVHRDLACHHFVFRNDGFPGDLLLVDFNYARRILRHKSCCVRPTTSGAYGYFSSCTAPEVYLCRGDIDCPTKCRCTREWPNTFATSSQTSGGSSPEPCASPYLAPVMGGRFLVLAPYRLSNSFKKSHIPERLEKIDISNRKEVPKKPTSEKVETSDGVVLPRCGVKYFDNLRAASTQLATLDPRKMEDYDDVSSFPTSVAPSANLSPRLPSPSSSTAPITVDKSKRSKLYEEEFHEWTAKCPKDSVKFREICDGCDGKAVCPVYSNLTSQECESATPSESKEELCRCPLCECTGGKSDIWSLGCILREILTGVSSRGTRRKLFETKEPPNLETHQFYSLFADVESYLHYLTFQALRRNSETFKNENGDFEEVFESPLRRTTTAGGEEYAFNSNVLRSPQNRLSSSSTNMISSLRRLSSCPVDTVVHYGLYKTAVQEIAQDFKEWRELTIRVQPRILHLLQRCLQTDAHLRPTAQEVRNTLKECLDLVQEFHDRHLLLSVEEL